MNEQTLDLKDIHLPEPISWWPLAPGWWMLLASVIFIIITALTLRKIYQGRQLKRDIKAELAQIKQQFGQTQNKAQLARSLSVLLRRASITYKPKTKAAGLTGDNWLTWLDDNGNKSSLKNRFQSDTGRVLITAPYLPESTKLDYNAQALIQLCESWLLGNL